MWRSRRARRARSRRGPGRFTPDRRRGRICTIHGSAYAAAHRQVLQSNIDHSHTSTSPTLHAPFQSPLPWLQEKKMLSALLQTPTNAAIAGHRVSPRERLSHVVVSSAGWKQKGRRHRADVTAGGRYKESVAIKTRWTSIVQTSKSASVVSCAFLPSGVLVGDSERFIGARCQACLDCSWASSTRSPTTASRPSFLTPCRRPEC